MRLLVTGGRDFRDETLLFRALNVLNPDVVIHGDCRGADRLAGDWAQLNLVGQSACVVTQREYDRYGKAAPVMRNQRMLDTHEPTLVLATEGGRGTEDMIRRAKKAGVPVLRLV